MLPSFYFISIYASLLFSLIYMFLITCYRVLPLLRNSDTNCHLLLKLEYCMLWLPRRRRRFWQFACMALIFCLSSVKPRQPNIPSIKLHVVTLRKHLLFNNQMFSFAAGNWEQRVQRCFLERSYVKSQCSREQLHFMHCWCSVYNFVHLRPWQRPQRLLGY